MPKILVVDDEVELNDYSGYLHPADLDPLDSPDPWFDILRPNHRRTAAD